MPFQGGKKVMVGCWKQKGARGKPLPRTTVTIICARKFSTVSHFENILARKCKKPCWDSTCRRVISGDILSLANGTKRRKEVFKKVVQCTTFLKEETRTWVLVCQVYFWRQKPKKEGVGGRKWREASLCHMPPLQ